MLDKKFTLEYVDMAGKVEAQSGESREELESLIPHLRDEGYRHFNIIEN